MSHTISISDEAYEIVKKWSDWCELPLKRVASEIIRENPYAGEFLKKRMAYVEGDISEEEWKDYKSGCGGGDE